MRWLALLLGLTATAHADNYSAHVTANGSVATTDNTFAVEQGKQGDIFFQLRPGAMFAYNAPRMIHELNAEVELLQYIVHSQRPSVSWRAGWKSFWLPGPRSDLSTAVNASTGQLNALQSNLPPDQTAPVLLPPVSVASYRQADASQYFAYILDRESRFHQNAIARYTWSDDAQDVTPCGEGARTCITAKEVGAGIGYDRSLFRSQNVGLEVGGSYLHMLRLAPVGAMMGSRLDRQLNPRATAYWRYDIDKAWSVNLDGGMVYVNPVGTDPYRPLEKRRGAPFPVFGGVVAYSEAWGRASLTARRQVTPSQFLAQNTQNDIASLQIAMPLMLLDRETSLRKPLTVGLATVALERTQLIDPEQSKLLGRFLLTRIDAAIAYTPRPNTTYGFRAEFVHQGGDAIGEMAAASFNRLTLYATFSLRYPDTVAAKVPRRGNAVRADRRDLSPVGAEPVVPDPTEVLGEEGGER